MIPSFAPGTIIRIKDYQFEDGSQRDKYLIVLYSNTTEAFIIHSLTTSKNNFNLPGNQHGCNVMERNGYKIPYFFFPENVVLDTVSQFFFDVPTYVFFRTNVIKSSIQTLLDYDTSPFGVVELAILSNAELKRLLKCLLKSTFVDNSLHALLSDFKNTL